MFMKHREPEVKPVYIAKEVEVWKCPECIGWMQKTFTVTSSPQCPFCANPMTEGLREINVLAE